MKRFSENRVRIFKRKDTSKCLTGIRPFSRNAPESLYEMELTRAAIHSFANFCSKLKPEISGTAYKNLERVLQFRPNPFMDTSKFIYRIADDPFGE